MNGPKSIPHIIIAMSLNLRAYACFTDIVPIISQWKVSCETNRIVTSRTTRVTSVRAEERFHVVCAVAT